MKFSNIAFPAAAQVLVCVLLFVLQYVFFSLGDGSYHQPFSVTDAYIFVASVIAVCWYLLVLLCRKHLPKPQKAIPIFFFTIQAVLFVVLSFAHVNMSVNHGWLPAVQTLLLVGFTMAVGYDNFRYWLLSKAVFICAFSASHFLLPHRWTGGFLNLRPPLPVLVIFVNVYVIFIEFIAWRTVKAVKKMQKLNN